MVDISFVYLRQCTLKGILIAAEGVCFVLRVLKLMLCDRDASVRLRVLCNLLSLMTDCGVAVTFRKFLLSPGRMCNEDDCPHDQAVKSFLDVLIQRLEDKSKAVRIKSLSLFELMVSETRSMIPIMPLQTKKTGVEPSTPSKEDCKPVENCLGHSEEAATNFHLLQVVEFIQWMLLQMLPLFRLLLALPCNSPFFCDETVELIGRLLCSARAHLVGQASMMIHRQNPQQVTLPFLRTFAADRCKTIAGELQCFFCQTYVSDVAKSVVRRILQAYFGGGFRSWRSFLSLCSEKNLSKIAELLQDVGRSAHCKAEWESRGSTKGKGGGGTLKGTSEEAKMAQEREQDGKNRLRRAAESFAVQALSMLVDIAHGCARPGPKPYHSEPMSARRWNKGSPDATNLGPLTQSSRDRGLRPEDSAYEGLVLGCLVTIGVLGDAKQHRERAASSVICSPARQTSAWSIDLLHSLQLRPRENIRALIYIIRQLARTLASGIQHSGRGEGGGGMGIDRSSGQTAELQSIAFHYDDQEDPAGLQLSPDARHSTEFRSIEWALEVMSMIVSANLMDEEAIAVIDAEGFIGDQFINLFPYFRGAVIDLLFSIKDPVTAVKKILRTYELKLGVLSGPAKVGMVRQYLQFLGDTARIYEIAQESFQQRLKDAQKKIRSGQGRRDASSCTESQGLEGREGGDVQRSSQQIFRSLMHEDFDYMLPLLVLVAVLLLVVVFFHVCFIGLVPLTARRRRSSEKADRMDRRLDNGRPAGTTSGASNRQHSAGSVVKRSYDPRLYAHLPSHEIPLSSSDDEGGNARSSTLPLGSGSTQEWAATQSYGGRRVETPWSYTSLLNEGLCDDDGNAAVDLSFQLSSSSGAAATHTRIINPHPGVDCADNTHGGVCGLRDGGLPQSLREGGGNRNDSTSTVGGGVGARERPEWMRLSPASRSGSGAPPGRQRPEDLREEGADVHRDGRQLWAECRQALHQRGTETITRGVQLLHVDEGDEAAVEEAQGCDDVDGDDDCNSDDLPDIRPLGRKATNGGATARKGPATKTQRSKKMDDDTGRSDGDGGRNFWSVGDTIALVRAKRDQDLYIAGMGTSFARMKTREWKWEDVRARLQSMGVTREAVDCGKKWDNLMQQFKKVHKFQNLSGEKDYFKLASKARRSKGFSFVMDRSVYDEMEAMTKGDHTIHPKNLADTGAAGGVQMPAGAGAGHHGH
ncbi:hypothetical protein CBR_g48765 [Chara braunii]|uniref:Myb/SANT-like DNA-binding domain-containing protein n=1 Tax=Chara braunii TaxID=69332 RepID=A0A388M3A6_CHABU|nr:hypothetical protein CBR_g48765 [Chara braunii]|eukprot:GBG89054.1 hypothetical protein CBR_g48765 [Chara braunii]